uniref:Uncharacterized protein n=1 Tax=Arundo donax TaxID=35708 RepID=A0A0A9H0M6_ARUDO
MSPSLMRHVARSKSSSTCASTPENIATSKEAKARTM